MMILGVLFCLTIVIILWRRHARKKRIQRTKAWATERGVLGKGAPWWKRMFARKDRNGYDERMEKERLPRYRDEVISRHPESTVDGFIDAYADERSSWEYRSSIASRSLFSEITGERRRAPEPRAPVREQSMSVKSLHTTKSVGAKSSAKSTRKSERKLADVETEAERYARSVREKPRVVVEEDKEHPGIAPFLATEPFWMEPTGTGSSNSQSRNPFRR